VLEPLRVAVMTEVMEEVTAREVTVNVADVLPAGMLTVVGD
jgi:flagellar basal body L-ring protein FlgH